LGILTRNRPSDESADLEIFVDRMYPQAVSGVAIQNRWSS